MSSIPLYIYFFGDFTVFERRVYYDKRRLRDIDGLCFMYGVFVTVLPFAAFAFSGPGVMGIPRFL